jgi:cytochrome c biogenesis protein
MPTTPPTTGQEPVVDTTTLSTQPQPVRPPALTPFELLRWAWRQLTSMRTALFLLFLLAVAAVPGGLVPQRGQNPVRVSEWIQQHPSLGPVFDRFSLFDVYASPWFAAVYLLLFISLAGCVLPRTRQHWKAMRARPPAAPRNLSRLPVARSLEADEDADVVLQQAQKVLRDKHFRVDIGSGWVAAEKGYLRETGNLVFHAALIVLLAGVALGSLFGYTANKLVVEGDGFANTPTQFDALTSGRLFREHDLAPFSFTLKDFKATYEERDIAQRGAPRTFEADVVLRDQPGSAARPVTIQVNHPLVVGGTKVFLVGHGYAPRFTVRDGRRKVVFQDAVPFLPQDSNFTSTGVVKVPDAKPTQLGFQGIFLPTAVVDQQRGPISVFPAAKNPAVFLSAWKGDLGLDRGVPQSVYKLDVTDMKRIGIKALAPGDTYTLEDGSGSITLDGFEEYATFRVAADPGKGLAFAGAAAAIVGLMLSLGIRRRRIWVRATHGDGGRTVVEVAGLSRSEAGDLDGEVDEVVDALGLEGPAETTTSPKRE